MPWYRYVCDKCGKAVQRKRPLAHRDSVGKHIDEDGCGDGELRRESAISGPPPDPASSRDPS